MSTTTDTTATPGAAARSKTTKNPGYRKAIWKKVGGIGTDDIFHSVSLCSRVSTCYTSLDNFAYHLVFFCVCF